MTAPSASDFNQLAQVYSICTLVLLIKYLFSLFYSSNSENHPEEDKILNLAPKPDDFKRRERQFANDIENLPLHLGVFWAAFLLQCFANASDNGKYETAALTALFPIYAGSRVLFTLFYICKIQPFRSIMFIIAVCSVVGAGALVVAAGFQIDFSKIFANIN